MIKVEDESLKFTENGNGWLFILLIRDVRTLTLLILLNIGYSVDWVSHLVLSELLVILLNNCIDYLIISFILVVLLHISATNIIDILFFLSVVNILNFLSVNIAIIVFFLIVIYLTI